MLQMVKGVVKDVASEGFGPSVQRYVRRARRQLARADARLLVSYLGQHEVRKLQLGCGNNLLPGWLNSDVEPVSPAVLTLNVTRPFPLPSEAFDFIFTEHMIEHLPFEVGSRMLQESHRVLRPGGRLRVSTPDLAFLVALHGTESTPLQGEYIQWSTRNQVTWAPLPDGGYVINNFVRAWGHCFIYDVRTLERSMRSAGFDQIQRCALNQSEAPELRGLENESRMPPGFLQLETFTLEGVRRS